MRFPGRISCIAKAQILAQSAVDCALHRRSVNIRSCGVPQSTPESAADLELGEISGIPEIRLKIAFLV
jgi:hypothetical protein